MSQDEQRRDGEGFFSAWSRRKRTAAREAAEEQSVEAEDQASDIAASADTVTPEEVEVDEDYLASLPSLDEITGQTDLQLFMKKGVPEPLRKAAMRKVWLANTLIRNHDDPAVDYAWDWNAPEGVPGAGGTLSEEGVSKMVKDLVNRARPDEPEETTQAEAPAVDEDLEDTGRSSTDTTVAAPDPAPQESAPQMPSVRLGDRSGVAMSASKEDQNPMTADAKDGEDSHAVRLPRHGGAIPRV